MKEKVIDIEELQQDQHNFNKGTEAGAELMERSFRELGAGRSVLIDKNGNIIAGNKSQKAAIAAGIKKVRIIETDGSELVAVQRTDIDIESKEGRELAFMDNYTQQVSLAWDQAELDKADTEYGLELEELGFEMPEREEEETEEEAIERKRKEFEERMAAGELDEDDPEYQEFLKKFEAKKTTDDCYTPDVIYEAVAEWVASEYGISRANFVRPFYPGGDYQKEKYKPSDIVVDNPPFSILAEITRFYQQTNIKFFLFAPRISNLSVAANQHFTNICVGAGITYDNGAVVPTSYITNLETEYIAKSSPSLYKAVTEADKKSQSEVHREIPKYIYPDHVVTAAILSKYSKYGVDFGVKFSESVYINELDFQKKENKQIYAGGLLISDNKAAEKAAAEKAAAVVWELSDREKEIIKGLK